MAVYKIAKSPLDRRENREGRRALAVGKIDKMAGLCFFCQSSLTAGNARGQKA
jgi:hypothetical protein